MRLSVNPQLDPQPMLPTQGKGLRTVGLSSPHTEHSKAAVQSLWKQEQARASRPPSCSVTAVKEPLTQSRGLQLARGTRTRRALSCSGNSCSRGQVGLSKSSHAEAEIPTIPQDARQSL